MSEEFLRDLHQENKIEKFQLFFYQTILPKRNGVFIQSNWNDSIINIPANKYLYMSATDDPNPMSNENLMQVNSLCPSSIFILSEYGPYDK